MFGSLLLTSLLAATPLKIRVEVLEVGSTTKGVPAAKVTLRETAESSQQVPRELQAITDATGRAWFEVPHLGFEPVEIEKERYVTRAEMKPFRKEAGKLESMQQRGGAELFWQVWVYPRSQWKFQMKAATEAQAVALAQEWGRECGPSGPTKVEYYEPGATWTVKYPCLNVFVDAKNGSTMLQVQKPTTGTPLYPPADALQDALSSPLEFLARLQSDPHDVPQCAYRNQTVFVLDDYCTKKEIHSTGITVIHPQRGTAHFYAEAKSPISTTRREDWDHWHFETYDPYPGASISMSWAEIDKHETRRRRFQDAVCWASLTSQQGGSCTNKTEDIKQGWPGIYRSMLKQPPETWFALVRALRRLAENNGKADPRGESQNPVMPATAPLTRSDGAGRFGIIVEVEEYYTVKPVVGAKVTLRDPTGKNPELLGLTNARGKVRFEAPHLQYELASIDHPSILSFAELAPIRDLFKSIDTRREPNGEDEIKLEQSVVNRKWLDANMKVRTAEQAVQIADTWGRACGGKPTRVTRPYSWKVEYPCVVVHVDTWEGDGMDPTVQKLTPDEVSARRLYPPEEALADALASPLEHLGTGVWPGRYKIPSCAYRNDKVVVLDSFCTLREMNPTTVWIFNPERGTVVFSARGDRGALVSKVKRDQYEQWGFSTLEPYPGLKLAMTFSELTSWEKRRSVFSRGSCGAALATSASTRGSCSLKTPEIERWWQGYYGPLLEDAPSEWYELVKRVRALAPRYGKKDPRDE
ncbi:hypothetical protein [Vitiosangium sp. GDMCC 1.1324]|uniref:hypothetical protein n=1 Tax=Vitiosangium sp. (strain GDMCC 1.1324) TaxID=2138576 RepID=UPI000D364429|nr:hypothetical protein [Vitiosangium sp. GDMCC 1.1324]PTL82139.1 hypothetical protein DAT35_20285 [Vitiosangium sp. GDMCC 1.1324]